jgi:hypothetical protein
MSRLIVALALAILLSGCTALKTATSGPPLSTAVVTGIASGRASVPNERMYGLRTPGGRVYFVTQSLRQPLKEGDVVEIETGNGGAMRIRER